MRYGCYNFNKTYALIILNLLSLLACGCIRDQAFRPVDNKPANFAPPDIGKNVAVIEFNDPGRLHPCCGAEQLKYAQDLIESARNADGGPQKLVVIVFIHGNWNNASVWSDNYPHFLQLIDCLNVGGKTFDSQYAALSARPDDELGRRYNKFKGDSKVECSTPAPDDKTKYVGIYIGWRGATNRLHLDLRQAAAERVAGSEDLLKVLRSLRNAAKPARKDGSRFVVLGHSFGGLILERAVYRLYDGLPATQSATPFADLLLTINQASNGTIAKRLIEKTNQPTPQFLAAVKQHSPSRPILVSLHSKSDAWTGRAGTVLRSIVPAPGMKDDGVYAEPDYVQSGERPKASLINHSTPANLLFFDNLCYINEGTLKDSKDKKDYVTGDQVACDDLAELLVDPKKVQKTSFSIFPVGQPLDPPNDEKPIAYLYWRFSYSCYGNSEALHDGKSKFEGDMRDPCTNLTKEPQPSDFNQPPWNRSAFWLVNVPDDLISKHGGFWSPDSVNFIKALYSSWPTLNHDDVIP